MPHFPLRPPSEQTNEPEMAEMPESGGGVDKKTGLGFTVKTPTPGTKLVLTFSPATTKSVAAVFTADVSTSSVMVPLYNGPDTGIRNDVVVGPGSPTLWKSVLSSLTYHQLLLDATTICRMRGAFLGLQICFVASQR